jgi:hypothetical protein
MKSLPLVVAFTLFAFSVPGFSQFGGIHLPKPSSGNDVLARGGSLESYLTAATDQGMRALDELAKAFPPEKVAAFQKLSGKYHESAKNRPDGNIDADSFTVASDAADEMAKLENDWQSYKKEGTKEVRRAHARLGLMLIADAEASTQARKELTDLEAQVRIVAMNPLQTSKATRMRTMMTFMNTVIQQAPRQTQSFTTVRRIAKNIADAEHYKLADDPSPESVSTTANLATAAKKIDTDIPGEN